ncbi:MAG: hypothetical protein ABI128_04100 [Rhodanobacter sp.]
MSSVKSGPAADYLVVLQVEPRDVTTPRIHRPLCFRAVKAGGEDTLKVIDL